MNRATYLQVSLTSTKVLKNSKSSQPHKHKGIKKFQASHLTLHQSASHGETLMSWPKRTQSWTWPHAPGIRSLVPQIHQRNRERNAPPLTSGAIQRLALKPYPNHHIGTRHPCERSTNSEPQQSTHFLEFPQMLMVDEFKNDRQSCLPSSTEKFFPFRTLVTSPVMASVTSDTSVPAIVRIDLALLWEVQSAGTTCRIACATVKVTRHRR
jgi:hypothetical protein